jgi:hypothetical protein
MNYVAPARRPYIHHNTLTTNYLRNNYQSSTIPKMAKELGIPAQSLKALARREGLKKEKSLF